ncbi:hypothetical protein [Halostreptopolyspora alba]|uniref:DUF91 domain-containing protein n=1 Tax=Halostreptopolyspora alba TaxID=2487137 RepID=A0A3N0EIK7_9ACTN|nr:hypothetical protein EFW17_01575 [Nocardiopsaceae bacterium YIM 96095]
MASDIALWRVDQGSPTRLCSAGLPLESRLEDLIEQDPAVLGEQLLILGRQVPTALGRRVDMLGLASDGTLHVIELKRDRAPRDVLAQVIEYGAWARLRAHADIVALYEEHHPGGDFSSAFYNAFGSPPPEERQRFTDLLLWGSHASDGDREDRTLAEYVVPVVWEKTRAREDAVWLKDMFANQNSACPLRHALTQTILRGEFGDGE